jgi:adenine/guanine phosphoribosyltransferase-like PRPP-binding protein
MKRRILAAVAALAFAAALAAHGGAEHVIGFVRAISAQSVTVETLKHETVTVVLTAKTEAMKSGVKANAKDLKVGDRVVIHATKNGAGALEASEVEWGPAAQKK